MTQLQPQPQPQPQPQQYKATKAFETRGFFANLDGSQGGYKSNIEIPINTIFTRLSSPPTRTMPDKNDAIVSCTINGQNYTGIHLYIEYELNTEAYEPFTQLFQIIHKGGRVNRRAIKKKSLKNHHNIRSRYSRRK